MQHAYQLLEVAQQFGGAYVQRCGDLDNDRERRHVIATLDKPDICRAHLSTFRELLLRETSCLSQTSHHSAELLRFWSARFSVRHSCTLTMVNLSCLVTMLKIHGRRAGQVGGRHG